MITDSTAPPSVRPTHGNSLKIIVDPSDPHDRSHRGPTKVDIVAVHGLKSTDDSSHASATWSKEGKLWLKDFLPGSLPNARIMLFSYDANLAFKSSAYGVPEQAQDLLNRLRIKRQRCPENRPIIFIAHSLGGIVVKRALVTANQQEVHRPIREATFGLVFFSTPHSDSDHMPLGRTVGNIFRSTLPNVTQSFIDNLEKDDLYNARQIQEFRTQLEDFKIINFYETWDTPGLGVLVDYPSALLGVTSGNGYNRGEQIISISLDHHNICKFESENDEYEMVSYSIVKLVELAIKKSQKVEIKEPALPYKENLPLQEDEEEEEEAETDEPRQGLGIQELDAGMDAMSMTSSVERAPTSVDASEDGQLRRQSTSTSMTSSPSLGSSAKPGKYTKQSPRLGSAIKMNIKDTDGYNLRSYAAAGKKDEVMALLERGVPIDNSGVWDGYTALADAVVHGQEEVAQLLLNQGANPSFNCLHSTSKFGSKENTVLALAVGNGHLGCVRLLLAYHNYETTELNKAFRAGKYKNRTDCMKLIQEAGGGNY